MEKGKKALFLLYQGIYKSAFEKIAEATSSKKACDVLATIFKGVEHVTHVRLKILRAQFEAMQMREYESVHYIFLEH